jgi:hypothetical protein
MKLSTLINYRTQLRNIDLAPMQKSVQGELSKVLYLINNQSNMNDKLARLLSNQSVQVQGSIADFENMFKQFEHKVDEVITQVEQPYFLQSYNLYENEMNNETLADLKNRSPNLAPSTVEFYRSRILRYIGWQHPAMIVRPAFETYIADMVSCDPLYLVDLNYELFEPALERYNQLFQSRLRRYTVSERTDQEILQNLPDSQFGLILAFNYFNFRPFEVIRRWMTEMLQKLKPGGMLLMTINDCNRDKAVMLVEQNYCCYTPGHLVMQLAETLGFEVVFKWDDNGPMTWIELKKPGTLTTLRGGQTLAKILPKPIAESK